MKKTKTKFIFNPDGKGAMGLTDEEKARRAEVNRKYKIHKSEKWLERMLVEWVRQAGGVCLKFASPGYSGVPDRVILLYGLVFWVELKTYGKEPSSIQKIVHKRFEKHGHIVHIVDSEEKLIKFKQYVVEVLRNLGKI